MNNPRLQLKNVGQIEDADVEFGDLTVFVGPQATGKSIFLQFLRLLLDTGYVIDEMGTHGLVWNKDIGHFLDIYLGEGMRDVWRIGDNGSAILYNGDPIELSTLKKNPALTPPAEKILSAIVGIMYT
jgi:hypothetical protein